MSLVKPSTSFSTAVGGCVIVSSSFSNSEVSRSFAVSLLMSMTAALSISKWGDRARRRRRRRATDGSCDSAEAVRRESTDFWELLVSSSRLRRRRLTTEGESTELSFNPPGRRRTTDGESADAVRLESTEFSGFRVDKESASSLEDSNNASDGGRSGDVDLSRTKDAANSRRFPTGDLWFESGGNIWSSFVAFSSEMA